MGEGAGRGEEAPEENAEGPGRDAFFEPGGVNGPALVGVDREGDDEPSEGDRKADAEVAGEMIGVEEGAGNPPRFLLGGDGPGGLGGHTG